MQLSEQELRDRAMECFSADVLAGDQISVREAVKETVRVVLNALAEQNRAQADARPVAWRVTGHWKDGAQANPFFYTDEVLADMHAEHLASAVIVPLYTHPEASAPGLSDDQLMRFAPATPKDFLAQAKKLQDAILTRASAATVPSFERRDPAEELAACQRYYAATVAEPSEDAKRLENIVAIGWEGLRKAWERFGEDHECETALEEIRAVIDADRAHPQAAQQQAEPMSMQDVLDLQKGRHALRPKLSEDVLGSIDKFGDEPTALFNEQQAEPGADERSEVDRIACVLLEAFQQAEPFHVISKNPQSYLATFADMARAALAAQSGQRAGVAEGWCFYSADFSCNASNPANWGTVMLTRDDAGRKWWHALSDKEREEIDLFVSGRGTTFDAAMKSANEKAAAAPTPAAQGGV